MTPPELMFFSSHPPSLLQRIWLRTQMRKIDRALKQSDWLIVPFQFPWDEAPRWFSTLGLEEMLDHPELIIFDQPAWAVWNSLRGIVEGIGEGVSLEDGMQINADGDVPCVAREVHPSQISAGWFGLALERRRILKGDADGFRAFQVVVADKRGFLPWEAGYDEAVRIWQPGLYEPYSSD